MKKTMTWILLLTLCLALLLTACGEKPAPPPIPPRSRHRPCRHRSLSPTLYPRHRSEYPHRPRCAEVL